MGAFLSQLRIWVCPLRLWLSWLWAWLAVSLTLCRPSLGSLNPGPFSLRCGERLSRVLERTSADRFDLSHPTLPFPPSLRSTATLSFPRLCTVPPPQPSRAAPSRRPPISARVARSCSTIAVCAASSSHSCAVQSLPVCCVSRSPSPVVGPRLSSSSPRLPAPPPSPVPASDRSSTPPRVVREGRRPAV